MNTWPPKYRILAVACFLVATTALLVYLFMLRPLSVEVAGRQDAVEKEIADIHRNAWPADPDQLEILKRQEQNRLNTLKINLAEIQERATQTFADRIQAKYGPDAVDDPEKFIRYAGVLDYQIYYEEITSNWQKRGVALVPEVLKLSTVSEADDIHQSVLQLWSLDKILETVARNGMRPLTTFVRIPKTGARGVTETVPPSAYQTVRAAAVTLLPVREYRTQKDAEAGYLLEMPVRLTVRCTIDQLDAFLRDLSSESYLVPLNAIEIYKLPSTRRDRESKILEVKMECSTFYPMQRENTAELRKAAPPLPAGA